MMRNKTLHAALGKSSAWFTVLLSMALLSACANTWSAKVTTYQNWPTDAFSAPYFIEPALDNESQLIHQAVADTVRVAMGAVSFIHQVLLQNPFRFIKIHYK